MNMRSALTLGLLIILFTLLCDQALKWWILEGLNLDNRHPIIVTPFFNLTMVWNRGISFGFFADKGEEGIWALCGLALAIVAGMLVWMARTKDRWLILAQGLIMGGALGNVLDRVRFGAVADFFDFHLMGYHWPAFNIADSAIFLGVVLLLLESLWRKPAISEHKI